MGHTVVSAVKFEVEPLLQALAQRNIKARYLETGIGALHAARSSKGLGQACEGEDVIYVGTCGSFGPFEAPELVRIESTLWLTPCERAGIAWAIENIDLPVDLPPPPAWAAKLPSRIAVCSPNIAKSSALVPEVHERYPNLDPSRLVENLELYSCAQDIITSAKSFVAILGITNSLCLDGRKQWRQHFRTAAQATADFVTKHLP